MPKITEINESGKKEKSEIRVNAKASPNMPFYFMVTKAQASDLMVGDNIKVRVEGEVVSIRKPMGGAPGEGEPDQDHLEIELRSAKKVEVESNPADVALRQMKTQPNASRT